VSGFLISTPFRTVKGWSWLDASIGMYLALPLIVFLAAWLRPLYSIPTLIALVYFASNLFSRRRFMQERIPAGICFGLALLALGWVALGGTGHWFYANVDWVFRDALLRDLVVTPWPPQYIGGDGESLIMRAPIAYFLPAALVGHFAGLAAAHVVLYVWTALGFFLVLTSVCQLFEVKGQKLIAVALVLGFGGLDLLGYLAINRQLPVVGEHIEWWAGFAQFSSNSTLLYWVPNHALPAWLGTVLVLRHWRGSELARLAPLLGACIPLWSPLAALGLVPIILMGINWSQDAKVLFAPKRFVPAAILALLCICYLTMGSGTIPGEWIFENPQNVAALFNLYVLLCFLEFGILALLILRLRAGSGLVLMAMALLLVMPAYKFGYGNDLVMRASIPALLVLALSTVRPLTEPGHLGWRIILAVVLGIGAVGAMQEPARAVVSPRWPAMDISLTDASREYSGIAAPVTYVSKLDSRVLRALLREPVLVRSSLTAGGRYPPGEDENGR